MLLPGVKTNLSLQEASINLTGASWLLRNDNMQRARYLPGKQLSWFVLEHCLSYSLCAKHYIPPCCRSSSEASPYPSPHLSGCQVFMLSSASLSPHNFGNTKVDHIYLIPEGVQGFVPTEADQTFVSYQQPINTVALCGTGLLQGEALGTAAFYCLACISSEDEQSQ